ncbi:MAG: S9 family peptidase, partial [Sphingopyxis terrae]
MMRKLALLGASLLTLAAQPLYAQQGAAPEPSSAPTTAAAAQDDATGSAQTGPQRRFTGEDLFGLAAASDPQISPDGRHIAYVRRANDIM